MKSEYWFTTGPVEMGSYPNAFLAYGVETEAGKKVALCPTPEYAVEIVRLHNATVPVPAGGRR